MIPKLTESESFIKGRSISTAKALLESAGDRGSEVRTTSHGYVLPTELVPAGYEGQSFTAADRPAVPTEPGTSTNVEEVNNVGGPATAVAESPNAAADGEEPAVRFDPSKATIAEVKTYLDGADDAERTRVIDEEKASAKPRQGVLDLAATPEGDK